MRAGRERAGKGLEEFEIVTAAPAALTDDGPAAYDAMRSELLIYFGLPFNRTILERSGYGRILPRSTPPAATPRPWARRSPTGSSAR